MRRVQIYLDDEMDDSLEAEAARRGVSKAALIRAAVGREFKPVQPTKDGWEALVGWLDLGPVDDIDEVIYRLPE
ncbi:MAG: ribbon-helix-helix domain-containing protein [Candidatus Dormibacteraeota bacterium]|nr:ribbon-helix-helix domain-containing protein [Candidatus Dormibacteraeota bacterium]